MAEGDDKQNKGFWAGLLAKDDASGFAFDDLSGWRKNLYIAFLFFVGIAAGIRSILPDRTFRQVFEDLRKSFGETFTKVDSTAAGQQQESQQQQEPAQHQEQHD